MDSQGYASSALPGDVPMSEEVIVEESMNLWDTMNLDHVKAVEIDSATTISFELYLIPARIPSSSKDPGSIPKTDEVRD